MAARMLDLETAPAFSTLLVFDSVSFSRPFLSTSMVVDMASDDEHSISALLPNPVSHQAPTRTATRATPTKPHFTQREDKDITRPYSPEIIPNAKKCVGSEPLSDAAMMTACAAVMLAEAICPVSAARARAHGSAAGCDRTMNTVAADIDVRVCTADFVCSRLGRGWSVNQ